MKRLNKRSFAVRYFDPSGGYPEVDFSNQDVDYSFDSNKNILCSVVRLQDHDNAFYDSEVGWAFPSEIRLWGALSLSVPKDQGWITIIPAERSRIIHEYEVSLEVDFDSLKGLGSLLLNSKEYMDVFKGKESVGTEYNFHPYPVNEAILKTLYESVDPTNHVLIRGLSCFLKSQFLARSRLTFEEATLLVYISLEAAFALIKIRNSYQSYEQVYKYISDEITGGEYLAEYYRDCRKNRNILSHPDSKDGPYGIPPLSADDFCDTFISLSRLYRFIIAGIDIEDE